MKFLSDNYSFKSKVIEYGADDLGFQPVGDLPEGIVVPPPVPGNDTSGIFFRQITTFIKVGLAFVFGVQTL